MPEPIRVRDDETGAEYSTYAVDENGQSYPGLTVLDEPAADDTGTLLPPKYPDPKPEPAAPETPAETGSTVTVPPADDVVAPTGKKSGPTARTTAPTTTEEN